MRSDKGEAFLLRRNGKSYREIEALLGVSKGTLTNWFRGVDFSAAIKDELIKEAKKKRIRHLNRLNKKRGIALSVQYELAEKEAEKDLQHFRNVPLFVAGISVYLATGQRQSKNQLKLTSANPETIELFVAFLKTFAGLEEKDMRLALFVSDEAAEAKSKRYWSKITGIKRFHKTQVPASAKTAGNGARYGTATVVVHSTVVTKKMRIWIDHLPEMVLNTVPKREQKKKK